MARTGASATDILTLSYAGIAVMSFLAAIALFDVAFGQSTSNIATVIVPFAAVIGVVQLLRGFLLYRNNYSSLSVALLTFAGAMIWSAISILLTAKAAGTATAIAVFVWMPLFVPAMVFTIRDNQGKMSVLLVFVEAAILFSGLAALFDPSEHQGFSMMAGVLWLVCTGTAAAFCFNPTASVSIPFFGKGLFRGHNT